MIVDKSAFVHIPRTGGRIICSNLIENYPTTLYSWEDWVKFDGIPIEKNHQPASFYKNIKNKFTVVRNPYQRFLSIINDMTIHGLKIKENFEIDSILKFIDEDKGRAYFKCWIMEQHKFIDNNTKIWFFENGVDSEKFYDWMRDVVGLPIKNRVKKIDQRFFHPIDSNHDFVLSDKMKELVKHMYYQDFKIFNYDF